MSGTHLANAKRSAHTSTLMWFQMNHYVAVSTLLKQYSAPTAQRAIALQLTTPRRWLSSRRKLTYSSSKPQRRCEACETRSRTRSSSHQRGWYRHLADRNPNSASPKWVANWRTAFIVKFGPPNSMRRGLRCSLTKPTGSTLVVLWEYSGSTLVVLW